MDDGVTIGVVAVDMDDSVAVGVVAALVATSPAPATPVEEELEPTARMALTSGIRCRR
jgi:hypothetical protein